MKSGAFLTGQLLVAMPTLRDPYFERAVVFLCAHSDEGALGLVINQTHPASLDEVIDQLGMEWHGKAKPPVHMGGPVSVERGFILYEEDFGIPGHIQVVPRLFMGTNPDILRHLATTPEVYRFLFALGYAGWAPGQLEGELKENAWLVCDLDRNLLFDLPVELRWDAAISLMGINPAQLVDTGARTIN